LHVQRLPDGGLRAAFNVLQHGSCWTIPAQCAEGHKTRCPYVSCAYSRDTDAFAGHDGQPTDAMRQFIGFNALKLFSVPVQKFGPLLFVSLAPDGSPPLVDQLEALGVAIQPGDLAALPFVARFWAELDCPWTVASDALFAALGAPGSTQLAETVDAPPGLAGAARLWRAFPNLAVAALDDHVACLVVKPVRIDGVVIVVALYGKRAIDEEAVAELVHRWQAVMATAGRHALMLEEQASSPIAARALERLAVT
jgi:hypothetical protein